MYSRQKHLSLDSWVLLFGYFCHRSTLLYDSLTNDPWMDRLAYILGEGLNCKSSILCGFYFTQKSLLAFLFLGF